MVNKAQRKRLIPHETMASIEATAEDIQKILFRVRGREVQEKKGPDSR